jgi:hypothetical protein
MGSFWLWLIVIIVLYVIFFSGSGTRKKRGQRQAGDIRTSTAIQGTRASFDSYIRSHRADEGETVWGGEPVQIEFEYCNAQGEYTKRTIRLERVYKTGGANYFRGYCYLRNEERNFKLSRVLGNISIDGNTISTRDLVKRLAGKFQKTSARHVKVCNSSNVGTKATRSKAIRGRGKLVWREEGVLSLSGYRVGKSKGVGTVQRRQILDTLMIEDDLYDVVDRAYALEWGEPGTTDRYKKIHDSISVFLFNGRARNDQGHIDMSQAIDEWESDLAYIEQKYIQIDQ